MMQQKKFLVRKRKKEDGAAMVEYGLLVALIAVVCIAAVTTLGGRLSNMFTSISQSVESQSGINTNAVNTNPNNNP